MKNAQKTLSKITGISLILVLVLGPLTFFYQGPWPYLLLTVAAFAALIASLMRELIRGGRCSAFSLLTCLGALGLLLVALQVASWPAYLLEKVQPASLSVHTVIAGFLEQPMPHRIAPSLYPHRTLLYLLRLASYVAIFAAACSYIDCRQNLNRLAGAVMGAGLVVSVLLLLQKLFAAADSIWPQSEASSSLLADHVAEPGSLASYVVVPFFLCIGFVLSRKKRYRLLPMRNFESDRAACPAPLKTILLLASALVMGAAIVLSASYLLLVPIALAMALLFGAMFISRHVTAWWLQAAIILMLVVSCMNIWIGGLPAGARLEAADTAIPEIIPGKGLRYQSWSEAISLGMKYPVLGAGAGTMDSVLSSSRNPTGNPAPGGFRGQYLTVFAESGATGLILLLLAFAVAALKSYSELYRTKSTCTFGLVAGGLGAVLVTALLSVVSAPLALPPAAASLMIVLAIIYRLCLCDKEKKAPATFSKIPFSLDTYMDEKEFMALKIALILAVCVSSVFAVKAVFGELNGQIERIHIARAARALDSRTVNAGEFVNASERAIRNCSPLSSSLYAELAEFSRLAAAALEDGDRSRELLARAGDLSESAAEKAPMDPVLRMKAVRDHLELENAELAWKHARIAAALHPDDPWIRLELARLFTENHPHMARNLLENAREIAEKNGDKAALAEVKTLPREFRQPGNKN